MPFNPAVILGGQPQQDQGSPFQTFSDLMRAKQSIDSQKIQKQNERMGAIQLEDAERARQDNDYFRTLVQQNSGPDGAPDWQKVSRSALAAGKFDVAQKAQTQFDSALRAQDQRYTASLARIKTNVGLVRPLFQAALEAYKPDKPETMAEAQALYDRALATAHETFGEDVPGPDGTPTKQVPELIKGLPPKFDPSAVRQMVRFGLTVEEDANLQTQAITAAKEAAELVDKGLSAAAKARESLGSLLATTRSQADWDNALKLYKGRPGFTPEVLQSFGDQWSPNAVDRAGRLAIGEKGWQDHLDKEADNIRADKTQGRLETQQRLTREAQVANNISDLDKWRADKLLDIDKREKTGDTNPFGASTKLPPADAAAERELVQKSYDTSVARLNGGGAAPVPPPGGSSIVLPQGRPTPFAPSSARPSVGPPPPMPVPPPQGAPPQAMSPGPPLAAPPPAVVPPQMSPAPPPPSAAPQGRPAPPAKGTRRMIRGQMAEWDGQGWVAVKGR